MKSMTLNHAVNKPSFKKYYTTKLTTPKAFVVHFDQRMHACTCICMVEDNEKHLKTIKKVLFSSYT